MTATVTSIAAPVTVGTISTQAGATVFVYTDLDGTLSSDCTGCGEYAWTLAADLGFARQHAAACFRRPRPLRLAA